MRKPEVDLFRIAAQRCGGTLGKGGWMIGDNLIADIQGGQMAGLRTIWINRGTWSGQEHHVDHAVTDVIDAIAILRSVHGEA
ncbi:HAD family hydrolase [Nonomuraea sp. NPDC003707]